MKAIKSDNKEEAKESESKVSLVKLSVLKKGLVATILVISVFAMFTAVASATTIYVPEGGNQTIQQAVNNATAGDTIVVRDAYTGTKENIDVNVPHLTIQSESGSANCIVNASNSNDHVFHVTANYVNITGFTVQNATGDGKAGIYLKNAKHCNISNNNASLNFRGISLSTSSNNTITNNAADSNKIGIHLELSSNNNTIADSNASSNDWFGIQLWSSSYNALTKNNLTENWVGISLESSSDYNNITNNTASDNGVGIGLYSSDNNSITNNTANSNEEGIFVRWSSHNIVDSNTVNDNDCVGIAIDSCFLGGTKILLADSTYKNIEDVEVGDFVQSYDEAKKEMVTGKVLKTFYHEKTDNYLVINGKLKLTPNHPMYVNNEWKEAGDIKIGDLLLDKDGNYVAVTSIEKIDNSVPVYNLEVSGYHNYFAEDTLTHNKCPLIFSYNGTGYQFDVMINVLAVGSEEDKLFEYPLKYLEEPGIRVEYDPKEINYIDFIKLIIEDTTEQEQEGLQNKTHLLDPISCSGTDFDCNLSLLEERDGQYLISDVDHKEFFLEFEDFPELESEYNRTIKIFSSGYQIILDGADFSCECEQVEGLCEFLDEYFSENNKNPYSNRYGNGNSYNTISNNEVSGNGFGEYRWPGNCGISLVYEDHTDIINNIVTENYRGIYLYYSSYNTIERNMIVNNTGAEKTGVHVTDGSDYNEIHGNCFIDNEPYQAVDDFVGDSNHWDGNYWSDYIPPGPYSIEGNANSEDSSPLDECPLGEKPPAPARVPALTPIGIIALVGLLSVVLAMSIRRKK